MALEKEKVLHAARHGIKVDVKTYQLPRETEMHLEEILAVFLQELGQSELQDHIIYCLRELTVNAKKANTKRVYFKEQNLDINKPADYEKGMKTFKQDTLDKIQHYLQLQEKHNLYIVVSFLIKDNNFTLTVRNNVPIAQKELNRVFDRIARSRAFESMEEAFSEVLDDSEGAGLGIVIMILMLRKMGLTEKAYDLASKDDETVATLTIPVGKVKLEKMNQLTEEIVSVIDNLPPFPENIARIQKMLADPEVNLDLVAKAMMMDPALTADLIKFVNSAQFGVRRRIESIAEAVKMVGIKGLKQILFPYGAHKLLGKFLEKQRSLWSDAVKVSWYAMELAKKFQFSREDQGEVQIGGLLYNIGHVILNYIHPDISERIMNFCKGKAITVDLFESISESIGQGEIGARIAEKWNFPSDLVAMIKYNNHPHSAPKPFQGLVSLIYLANAILLIEKDLVNYSQLNHSVFKAFKIKSEDEFMAIARPLKQAFDDTTPKT